MIGRVSVECARVDKHLNEQIIGMVVLESASQSAAMITLLKNTFRVINSQYWVGE